MQELQASVSQLHQLAATLVVQAEAYPYLLQAVCVSQGVEETGKVTKAVNSNLEEEYALPRLTR